MLTPEEFLESNGFLLSSKLDRAKIAGEFLLEMERGLKGEPSSLMMIPTFIGVNQRVPKNSEAIVLDAGGTNFRGAVVRLPNEIVSRHNRPMPGTRSEVTKTEFYEAFAQEVARLKVQAPSAKIGWCFSYPAAVTPDLDAELVKWTKGVKAPSVVGDCVGKELAKHLPMHDKIVVVNDTVATLLAAKVNEGDSMYSSYVGLVLGTGTNTAYVEKNANIEKLSGLDHYGSMIINAESGGFDKLPRSVFDEALDPKSPTPKINKFEMMIAGAYLGAIGLEILRAAARAGFFKKATNQLIGLGSLDTRDLSEFCAGMVTERTNPLFAIFQDADELKLARRLTLPVFERAATLTAIHLAAFVIKSGEGADPASPVAICIDGSTYYKTAAVNFAGIVKRELDDMLVTKRNIHYELLSEVKDAPMVGAAIAAVL